MQNGEKEINFRNLFIPLTTKKAILWIIAIGIIVYFNMLFNKFVWDDITYILLNSQNRLFNLQEIFEKNLFNQGGQYRPISDLYFSSLYIIFSGSTFFYHLLQLTTHIINTIFIFLIFKKFFNKILAFFLCLVFLIHPIQVESISYIASSDNPLFFFFCILAFYFCFKEKLSLKRLVAIFGLLFLSLLTRETSILFLFVILLFRLIFYRYQRFIFFTGIIIDTLLYILLRFVLVGENLTYLQLVPIDRLSFFQRILNIPVIIFFYLKTFFFPSVLVIEQMWVIPNINFSNFYLPLSIDLFVIIILVYLGLRISKKSKRQLIEYLFFCIWFAVGLAFHSQIFPLDWTVADRWFYFPIVGFLGIIGEYIKYLKIYNRLLQNYLYILAVVIIFLLSIRTMIRNSNWSDPITLFTHDIHYNDNFDMENNLSVMYLDKGDYKSAVYHGQKSISYLPTEGNIINLALAYTRLGEKELAQKAFERAFHTKTYLPLKYEHSEFLYSLYGAFLVFYNQPLDAEKIIKEGLKYYPLSNKLWLTMALSLYEQNDHKGALTAAQKADMLSPNDPQTVEIYSRLSNNLDINIVKENSKKP